MKRLRGWAAWLLVGLGCQGAESRPATRQSAEATVGLRNVDVTVVYPLPAADELDALIGAREMGLSPEVFGGTVPELDAFATLPGDEERLAALHAVAVRYDPCAGVVLPPVAQSACRAQLRLVFQSLQVEGGTTRARDGAVHAFYGLDAGAAADVVRELRRLREAHASEPEVALGVSPRFVEEGLDGPYARALRALIAKHAGAASLVRVTHFTRVANTRGVWAFASRERDGAGFRDGIVPTTDATMQTVRTISGGRWDVDLTPPSGSPDDPTRLFDVSLQEQSTAFRATVRTLNPRAHGSESIDCGSCHVAHDIAVFADQTMKLSVDESPDRFVSAYPLDATTKSLDDAVGFQNLHMLSYLGTTLSVSFRTANETAAVLELLNP